MPNTPRTDPFNNSNFLVEIDGILQSGFREVILLDERGQTVRRWNFFPAWPVKYQPSALNALGHDVVV